MSRYTRNTVILALIEGTYGTDSTPTGTNAMLTSKPQIRPLVANNVPRDVLLGYLGNKEHLVGTFYAECTFDVELVGSGTAGTRPAWGDLLLACGFAETTEAVTRVDYTPVSSAFPSVSIYWQDGGLQQKMLGARGDVTFKNNAGEIPVMSFSFKGLYTAATATANATPTLTGFVQPLVVSEANTSDLSFGGTHATTGAPAIAAATAYPSYGIEISMNNSVDHVPMLGGETIELTQRDPSAKFRLDLTAAQEVTFMTAVTAATLSTVGLVHGTAAGKKTLLWCPSVQRINPTKEEQSGKRLVGFEGRLVPTSGNDEFRLVLF